MERNSPFTALLVHAAGGSIVFFVPPRIALTRILLTRVLLLLLAGILRAAALLVLTWTLPGIALLLLAALAPLPVVMVAIHVSLLVEG
ncbi:MAG: hypothetical protein ACOZAM_15925 [Pseudomonadota bacterium]